MDIVFTVLKATLIIILIFVGFFLLYFNFIVALVVIKNRSPRKHKKMILFKHKLYHIREKRFIKIVDFVKLVAFDILSGKDYLRLFGIWAFTGYYGEGKTMGCLQFALSMKKNYPHRHIKIYSNINVVGQAWVYPAEILDDDGNVLREKQKLIMHWEEILFLPKNSIFIYDESQSDFSCNLGVGAFPDDLLRRITQVRKKQFAMFMTSPKYNRMNINIRESVNFVIICSNLFQMDRWFNYSFYRAEDYEDYRENKIKLRMNRYLNMSFVVHNIDYRQYNTIEEVSSIKSDKEEAPGTKKNVLSLDKFRNEYMKGLDNLNNRLAKLEK